MTDFDDNVSSTSGNVIPSDRSGLHFFEKQKALPENKVLAQLQALLPSGDELDIDSYEFLKHLDSSDNKPGTSINRYAKLQNSQLFLKSTHIRQVIQCIRDQAKLPGDLPLAIERYFSNTELLARTLKNIDEVMQLHATELELSKEAIESGVLHHTKAHADDIEHRVTYFLKPLNLFASLPHAKAFMHKLTTCIAMFHDHGHKKEYPVDSTIEEATGNRLYSWLLKAINFENDELLTDDEKSLKALIKFAVDCQIILGTTMIFSKSRTMDLIELFFTLDAIARDCGIAPQMSNEHLVKDMITTTVIMSICDKTPASLYDIVFQQAHNPTRSSYSAIKRYFGNSPLVLDDFFERSSKTSTSFCGTEAPGTFLPYYPRQAGLINQETFCIAMNAHLNMSVELADSNMIPLARQYATFIQVIRQTMSNGTFNQAEFDHAFEHYQVGNAITHLMLANIKREISFSQSQEGGLSWATNKLITLVGQHRPVNHRAGGAFLPFVKSDVPAIDAKNLQNFMTFLNELSDTQHINLLKELSMISICQSGFLNTLTNQLINVPINASLHSQPVSNASIFQPPTPTGRSNAIKMPAKNDEIAPGSDALREFGTGNSK